MTSPSVALMTTWRIPRLSVFLHLSFFAFPRHPWPLSPHILLSPTVFLLMSGFDCRLVRRTWTPFRLAPPLNR